MVEMHKSRLCTSPDEAQMIAWSQKEMQKVVNLNQQQVTVTDILRHDVTHTHTIMSVEQMENKYVTHSNLNL